MAGFGKLFLESKGQPIIYDGKSLILADRFPVQNKDVLVCSIEKTNSKQRQGFCIDITGYCEMDGEVFKQGKGVRMLFWEDTAPKQVKLKIFTKKDSVLVYNICEWEVPNRTSDIKDGSTKSIDYGHNGAAMIVEPIENGNRYRCSDTSSAEKEDQFGDIVFTIQKLIE